MYLNSFVNNHQIWMEKAPEYYHDSPTLFDNFFLPVSVPRTVRFITTSGSSFSKKWDLNLGIWL